MNGQRMINRIVQVMHEHPDEWMTASDISRYLPTRQSTPNIIGSFMFRICGDFPGFERKINTSTGWRYYRYTQSAEVDA